MPGAARHAPRHSMTRTAVWLLRWRLALHRCGVCVQRFDECALPRRAAVVRSSAMSAPGSVTTSMNSQPSTQHVTHDLRPLAGQRGCTSLASHREHSTLRAASMAGRRPTKVSGTLMMLPVIFFVSFGVAMRHTCDAAATQRVTRPTKSLPCRLHSGAKILQRQSCRTVNLRRLGPSIWIPSPVDRISAESHPCNREFIRCARKKSFRSARVL
jgi:hypothetical protein